MMYLKETSINKGFFFLLLQQGDKLGRININRHSTLKLEI